MNVISFSLALMSATLLSVTALAQEIPRNESDVRALATRLAQQIYAEPVQVQVSAVPTNGVYVVAAQFWAGNQMVALSVGGMTTEEQALLKSQPMDMVGKVHADRDRQLGQLCQQYDLSAPQLLDAGSPSGVPDILMSNSCVMKLAGIRGTGSVIVLVGPDNLHYAISAQRFGGVSNAELIELERDLLA